MSFSNVIHKNVAGPTSSITTAGADSSTANILVAHGSAYLATAPPITFSDSYGNTWVKLTAAQGAFYSHSQIAYAKNPMVGSGHTATLAGTDPIYAVLNFAAFSGANTTSPFNAENGAATSNSATLATGSVSPAGTDLFVTGIFMALQASVSINSSFTILDQLGYSSGQYFGAAMAWKESGSAENPTWTLSGTESVDFSATIASFLAAGGAATRPVKMAGYWGGFAGTSGGFAG